MRAGNQHLRRFRRYSVEAQSRTSRPLPSHTPPSPIAVRFSTIAPPYQSIILSSFFLKKNQSIILVSLLHFSSNVFFLRKKSRNIVLGITGNFVHVA